VPQFTIDDVADGDHSETYTVDDVGTVTVTVKSGKTFAWSSTFGIDAIYVRGRDTELSPNSYFYLYAPNADSDEATEDVELGTPPWHKWDTNKIKSISFCFDEENKTTTSSTDTTMPSTTTTTPVVSVTTAPPTVPMTTPPDTLPKTGSDNTGLLLALGGVLVLGGGALLATTRIFRRPSS
jgi:LPXTG-motif cell wall-anchored protein